MDGVLRFYRHLRAALGFEAERGQAGTVPDLFPAFGPDELLRLAMGLPPDFAAQRADLIAAIRQRFHRSGCFDRGSLDRALAAMATVQRELFIASEAAALAYLPTPCSIGHGQTISNPYVVAAMICAARLTARSTVLDVGTGSGYQAAVLAQLASDVVSIEIVPELALTARQRLVDLGYGSVLLVAGDGVTALHAPEHYDAILVAAGAAAVPMLLLAQLKPGGRLVMPIGPSSDDEQLLVLTKRGDDFEVRSFGPVRFVPLMGRYGRAGESDDPNIV